MRFEMQKSGFYNTNYQKILHEYMQYADKQFLSLFFKCSFLYFSENACFYRLFVYCYGLFVTLSVFCFSRSGLPFCFKKALNVM